MFVKKYEIKEHQGSIFCLTKDERFLYSASADKYVTRWNPQTGEQDSFAIKCDSSVYKIIHFKKKNILIIGTSLGDIHIIDTLNRYEIKFIKYHKVAIFEIQLDELNEKMFVGDADGNLSVWSTIDWSLLLNLPFDCGKIRTIEILELQNQVLIGSQDGKIRVLDKYFNLISTFEAHEGGCLAICYSDLKNKVVFTSGKDGYLRVWQLYDYKEIVAIPAHNESIYNLQVLDKYLFSISRDKTIKIWNINTLDFISKIDRKSGGHSHSINDILIFNSNLITAGDDKRIICWETQLF